MIIKRIYSRGFNGSEFYLELDEYPTEGDILHTTTDVIRVIDVFCHHDFFEDNIIVRVQLANNNPDVGFKSEIGDQVYLRAYQSLGGIKWYTDQRSHEGVQNSLNTLLIKKQ